MVNILGTIAMIASLVVIAFGLREQVVKNYRSKSTEGLANSLVYSVCVTYTIWAIYSWVKPDYFMAVTQTIGATVSYILLFQVFYYGRQTVKGDVNGVN